MITVIAEIKARPGQLDALVARFQILQREVLAEEGCYQYTPLTDSPASWPQQKRAPDTLFMLERWESHQHLERHLQTPHMVKHHQETQEMVAGVELRILEDRSR